MKNFTHNFYTHWTFRDIIVADWKNDIIKSNWSGEILADKNYVAERCLIESIKIGEGRIDSLLDL